jgi:hypothetical protein
MSPLSLYPLPNLILLQGIKPNKVLLDLCDFAEAYVSMPWDEARKKGIPKKFYKDITTHPILDALRVQLIVDLDFYARDQRHPAMLPHSRKEVEHHIELIRSQNWEQFMNEEYEGAFSRCEGSCAAKQLGHWPEQGAPRTFTKADVESALEYCKEVTQGVVDYGHIYRVLLSMGQ